MFVYKQVVESVVMVFKRDSIFILGFEVLKIGIKNAFTVESVKFFFSGEPCRFNTLHTPEIILNVSL